MKKWQFVEMREKKVHCFNDFGKNIFMRIGCLITFPLKEIINRDILSTLSIKNIHKNLGIQFGIVYYILLQEVE